MTVTQTAAVAPIIIRRMFKAPRARVFAAFTEADLLREWMCPPGFTITEAVAEPHKGGKYRLVMQYPPRDNSQWSHANDSNQIAAYGVFTEVRSPERLAYTMRHEGDPTDELVSAEFIDRGPETELVFRHEGFANERSRNEYEFGWNGAFEQLAAVL